MTLVWFLILLGPLVFFHELGHFAFAKAFGVKVVRFSLGFGPVLLKKKRGETEYCLSAIPLGGYVSMVGDDPDEELSEEDKKRTLEALPYWKKLVVVIAGPFTNFLLPVIFYFLYFLLAVDRVPPPHLGTVLPNMAAAKAGLRSGDQVVSIDGKKIQSFDEFRRIITNNPGKNLSIQVNRPGSGIVNVQLTPTLSIGKNAVGLPVRVGRVGVLLQGTLARVGITNTQSPLYQAGVRSGDRILGVTQGNKTFPVRFWSDWENVLPQLQQTPLTLHILGTSETATNAVLSQGVIRDIPIQNPKDLNDLESGELVVAAVRADSPAARWGIMPGDRLAGARLMNENEPIEACQFPEKPAASLVEIEEVLTRAEDKKICLAFVEPGPGIGCRQTVVLRQDKFQSVDRFGNRQISYDFGISTYRQLDAPEDIPVSGQLGFALHESWTTSWEITSGMVLGIGYMITGEVDRENVGSVVMIAQMAEVAAEHGWLFFLQMMALISLNLGLLNLLPIPLLDGGHVVLFTIEAIRRKKLGLKARSVITYVGLALILSLMIFGFRNDLVRCFRPKNEVPTRIQDTPQQQHGTQLSPLGRRPCPEIAP